MEIKNSDGSKGKTCSNCGGYGFTYGIRSSIGCIHCDQTGVAKPTTEELTKQIEELRNLLHESNSNAQ